jgi:lysophospholipase L1-like esterase
MNKKLIVIALIGIVFSVKAQIKLIQLYPNADHNKSHPTLTVYTVDPMVQPTGTAIIILPQVTSHKEYNIKVAEWFSKKGVAVFLLDYGLEDKNQLTITLAETDGFAAVSYIRRHSASYKLFPNLIGILGFEDGSLASISMALADTTSNRLDFVGIIDPNFTQVSLNAAKPDAPPLFIATAASGSKAKQLQYLGLYNDLKNAGQSTEIHLYANENNLLFDTSAGSWNNCFVGWLKGQGLLKPMSNEKTEARKTAEGWQNLKKYYDDLIYNDWSWLSKYRDANTQLPAPANGEKRVVFLGNSITENWYNIDSAFFKKNDYIGRGIGGQVSAQMLVRFREDVINLHPLAVVIEAGTNDIAENRGPISIKNIFGNIVSIIELAKVNKIKPIICPVLPATDFPWHHGLNPAQKIIKLNNMLKQYAKENHIVYVDYWSAMVNDKDGLKAKWSQDGFVHPNLAGYKVMEPLVQAAINKVL